MIFPYTLGIVAIMKNEEPYVKEWLDYHLNAGVDIIYLYDNDSDDGLEEIVLPYVEKGLVVYKKFPGEIKQINCYYEALQEYRWTCKYLAFIDGDEFIYPTNDGSIKDFVENFFCGSDDVAALYVYWYLFGSSGEVNADLSRGVLDRFRHRDKNTDELGKVIVNPRLTRYFNKNPHYSKSLTNLLVVNELGEGIHHSTRKTGDKIFIAHYSTKSKSEYIARHSGSNAFFEKQPQLNEDGSFNEDIFKDFDKNDVEDNRVFDYYLKNLKNPKTNQIESSECISSAFNILGNTRITMEEFLYSLHTLEANNLFTDDNNAEALKEIFQKSFYKVTNTMAAAHENSIVYSMELFMNEIPFLVKCAVFDIEYIKKLANSYYDILQIIYLNNVNFERASLLRENKKWLDSL